VHRADASVERDGLARRVAVAAGWVFVVASLPKFAFFRFELEQFERFGLPFPGAFVILAGLVELAGGIALIARRFVLVACTALGATMLVAIVASGILEGDVIPSLTVAPALLAAVAFVAARARSRTARPAARLASSGRSWPPRPH
jgi:uncharacterized membrane protein YphA (DoxX/SURF4 family)